MLCAVTDAAPTDDAPAAAALRPPRHRVSPRAVRYWTLRAALGWLVVIAAPAVWLGVAQAELAARFEAVLEQAAQYGGPAVALEFEHVFAGIGVGGLEEQHDAGVDGPALGVVEG